MPKVEYKSSSVGYPNESKFASALLEAGTKGLQNVASYYQNLPFAMLEADQNVRKNDILSRQNDLAEKRLGQELELALMKDATDRAVAQGNNETSRYVADQGVLGHQIAADASRDTTAMTVGAKDRETAQAAKAFDWKVAQDEKEAQMQKDFASAISQLQDFANAVIASKGEGLDRIYENARLEYTPGSSIEMGRWIPKELKPLLLDLEIKQSPYLKEVYGRITKANNVLSQAYAKQLAEEAEKNATTAPATNSNTGATLITPNSNIVIPNGQKYLDNLYNAWQD